ncbi:MAG: LysM peptidoglycan-binding domain-containing protein [Flavobacteriaceae bacterium]|nr:LysM peptidoglycan-binding domain-containing protein [Flavobacteriaceae bacterium]
MKFFIFCVSLMFYNNMFAQREIQKQISNKKSNTIVNNNPHLLYIVKTNDTYHAIAKANNLTINRLYELNAIDNNNILLVGTSLFIRDLTVKKRK